MVSSLDNVLTYFLCFSLRRVGFGSNWVCMLDINDHNDKGRTEFEPTLLISADELKQSALTAQPRMKLMLSSSAPIIFKRKNSLLKNMH